MCVQPSMPNNDCIIERNYERWREIQPKSQIYKYMRNLFMDEINKIIDNIAYQISLRTGFLEESRWNHVEFDGKRKK